MDGYIGYIHTHVMHKYACRLKNILQSVVGSVRMNFMNKEILSRFKKGEKIIIMSTLKSWIIFLFGSQS